MQLRVPVSIADWSPDVPLHPGFTFTRNIPVWARKTQCERVSDHEKIDPLAVINVTCQQGGTVKSGLECFNCKRFLDWSNDPGHESLTVSCKWSVLDKVADIMSLGPHFYTTHPHTPIATADLSARRANVRHLLVTFHHELIGLVCRCDLARDNGTNDLVIDRMHAPLHVISPHATLLEAAARLTVHGVGILPVVEDNLLVGVITRGDLRRVGMPEVFLPTAHCQSCGSHSGVSRLGDHGPDLCLKCLARQRLESNVQTPGPELVPGALTQLHT